MAKPTFQIKVTRRITLGAVGFSGQQMNALAEATVNAMRVRWAKGLDVNDTPAKPLGRGYSRRKQRRGSQPIPDLRLTGQLIASLRVLGAENGRAKIGFRDDQAIIKAYVNHQRRQQIGISPGDAAAVRPLALDFLQQNIRSAIRSVRAA